MYQWRLKSTYMYTLNGRRNNKRMWDIDNENNSNVAMVYIFIYVITSIQNETEMD